MVKEREPLEQAKIVIGSGFTSWDNLTENERKSSFREGIRNLDKVDWVPPEYQGDLEEARSVLRNGMAAGLAEYERKSALHTAMTELEKIEWVPPSCEES